MLNPLDHPICLKAPLRLAPSAWAEHVPFAMFLVDILRPGTIVELGVFSGVSYCAFCQAVAQLGLDCQCFAVDTWVGDEQSGFYGPEVLDDLRQHHDPLYEGFSNLLQTTFDQALSHFADGTIDLLHIDGYHKYESVKHDFDGWLSKMSSRGVILFHDTNERHDDFGVWKLWDELKLRYPHFEFTHEHGLGVLAVGGSYPEKLGELFETGPDERAFVRELFHGLGERLSIQINGNHALKTLSWQVTNKEQIIDSLSAQLADKENVIVERDKAIGWLQDELNQSQLENRHALQAVQELTELSDELRIEVESFSADLAAAQENSATLERRLAEEAKKSEQLLTTERDMVEKEQELRSLRRRAVS